MRRRWSLPSVTVGLLAAWGLLLAASGLAAAQVGPWPMLQQNLGHTGQSPLLGPLFPSGMPAGGREGVAGLRQDQDVADRRGRRDDLRRPGLQLLRHQWLPGHDDEVVHEAPRGCLRLRGASRLQPALREGRGLCGRPGQLAHRVRQGHRCGAVLCLDPPPPAPQPCPRPFRYNFGREGDIWASPAPGPGGEIYFVHTQSFDGLGTFTALRPDGSVKWKYTIGQ